MAEDLKGEYEESLTIRAPVDRVFDFIADVSNLPKYLPTTKDAQSQGGDRVRVQGEAQGHNYNADGYLSLDKRFQMANTTHDGHLTREQARSADVMNEVAENFDAIDTGHKGFVTEDDIRAWYKARRAARRQAAEDAAKS